MAETNTVMDQIIRIQSDRDRIDAKLQNLQLVTEKSNLDELTQAIEGIENKGKISAQVKVGETYTIPKGYHTGGGTVKGVTGEGQFTLQSKTVEPTKKVQEITKDDGFYGLDTVTVKPIPINYQDVTSVNATAADVLSPKMIVTSDGKLVAGTMQEMGAFTRTLNTETTFVDIPEGHHNGKGKVSITTEVKDAIPTKSSQEIAPTPGKVLSKVTVNPIPDEYITTNDATATAEQILVDQTAYVGGVKVTGTMPNNSSTSTKLDASKKSYSIPKGYHDGLGSVTISTEEKTVPELTRNIQTIEPTKGNVLSKVTVPAIPSELQDVSPTTVTAGEVLAGKVYVDAAGTPTEGTMPNRGKVDKILDINDHTYTIPSGYHNGTGSVKIVAEDKNITPTKKTQTESATPGHVIGSVTVNPIPSEYITTTDGDILASEVLAGKIGYANGEKIVGTMPNNKSSAVTLDTLSTNYEIPLGYHDGTGTVSINLETKTATPTKSSQPITPTSGSVLSQVTINPIPEKYQDVTGVTATAADVLEDKIIVDAKGQEIKGTMANNGSQNKDFDALKNTAVIIPAGYTTGGAVTLTKDLENALAAI